tara:strand:+ start:32202 stop:32753 length:552 start_codon:yes stop_codon:yes gene_type:complete
MASFNYEIPDEYLENASDFGFTTVDSDAVEQQERDVAEEVAGEISSNLIGQISTKISGLEGKINSVLLKMQDETDEDNVAGEINLVRIEEKIDKILAMENEELASSIQAQGESIRAVIDEVEERKSTLEDQYLDKMKEIEKLVLPLLVNLTKNPEREYLFWPDRSEKVNKQIGKVLSITRNAE